MINSRPVKTNPTLPRLSTGIASFFIPRTIVSQTIKADDSIKAIEGDWRKVGNDLRKAIQLYEVKYLKSNQ